MYRLTWNTLQFMRNLIICSFLSSKYDLIIYLNFCLNFYLLFAIVRYSMWTNSNDFFFCVCMCMCFVVGFYKNSHKNLSIIYQQDTDEVGFLYFVYFFFILFLSVLFSSYFNLFAAFYFDKNIQLTLMWIELRRQQSQFIFLIFTSHFFSL